MTTNNSNSAQHALPGLDETSERQAGNAPGRNGGSANSARAKRSTHIERAIRRRLTKRFYMTAGRSVARPRDRE